MQSHIRDDVDNHPTDKHELSLQDKDDGLQTVNGCQHDNGQNRKCSFVQSDDDDEVEKLYIRYKSR